MSQESPGMPQKQELPPNIERLETGATVKFVPASNEKLPAIVIVHGWGSQIFKSESGYENIRTLLKNDQYHTLSLSLRGHQHSDGKIEEVTRAQHEEDVRAAFAYLQTQANVDQSQIGAFGVSYGAYMLSTLADSLPIQKLGLRVPALYPDKGWDEPTKQQIGDPTLPEWRSLPHGAEECRALKGVAGFGGDMLLISSEYDEDMPPAIANSYAAAAKNVHSMEKIEMPGARHHFHGDPFNQEAFEALFDQWFKKQHPSHR
jgi:pimeloyl-ACP methyl ester carboxylesterase